MMAADNIRVLYLGPRQAGTHDASNVEQQSSGVVAAGGEFVRY